MFAVSVEAHWLETLRVPVSDGRLASAEPQALWSSSGRSLTWLRDPGGGALRRYELDGVPIFVSRMAESPPAWGSGWEPVRTLVADSRPLAHVWRADDGSLFLPFDPDAVIGALLAEAYLRAGASRTKEAVKAVARTAYYRVRPALPRTVQLALRRQFTRVQRLQRFPRWPVESALHDLYDILLQLCADVADEPLPWLAPWPAPFTWAVVLTHDVETAVGYRAIEQICRDEKLRGFRSSWNLVPERDYVVEDELVEELAADGFEVGVHGLRHDGRDLESERILRRRLPEMRASAERWGATGFRAPATQRSWDLMPLLGFDYDSSYPDTDPYEPQGGGCCSLLPFFIEDLVELPITLPQDHTLFAILGEDDARTWLDKSEAIRRRGAMALLDTHPDYLVEESAHDAYLTFLDAVSGDQDAWRALPREVSRWWRDRRATRISRQDRAWVAEGPAAERAAILFVMPQAAYR